VTVTLDNIPLDVPCPICDYPIFVLMSEVQAQVHIRCSCCWALVHLIDNDASVADATRRVESSLRELFESLGGF
jgi:hypothetical protein